MELSRFDELVLRGVRHLGADAYGMSVRQTVAALTKSDPSIGAVYAALARLEKQGFIRSWKGEPTPERGGRAKRFFEILGKGELALADIDRVSRSLMPRPAIG